MHVSKSLQGNQAGEAARSHDREGDMQLSLAPLWILIDSHFTFFESV